jgi:hypothetical protein
MAPSHHGDAEVVEVERLGRAILEAVDAVRRRRSAA